MKIYIFILFLSVVFFGTQIKAAIPSTVTKSDSSFVDENDKLSSLTNNSLTEFKSLSKRERKLRIQEAKLLVKQYKNDKKAGIADENSNLLLIILAVLLPPLAVYLHQGEVNDKFWISVLLSLLLWVPGIIYALLVIFGKV